MDGESYGGDSQTGVNRTLHKYVLVGWWTQGTVHVLRDMYKYKRFSYLSLFSMTEWALSGDETHSTALYHEYCPKQA